MRAIYFERNGGPEVLELQDRPAPEPRDGEVLVEIDAVGVNYRDVYERNGGGYGSAPPAIIGVEGAGTIAGTGERVAWAHVDGSYAQKLAAPRGKLVPVPDGVSSEVAAAAVLQGMTAHYLACDSYPVGRGRLGARPRRGGRRRAAAHPDRQVARRPRDRDHVDRLRRRTSPARPVPTR